MTLKNDRTITTPASHMSTSRGHQRNKHTGNLPSSSESLPSQSTSRSSESNQGPNKKENDRDEAIPLYISTTFASILCILAFGVLAVLYLKKKIRTKVVLNAQARITSKYIIFVFMHEFICHFCHKRFIYTSRKDMSFKSKNCFIQIRP